MNQIDMIFSAIMLPTSDWICSHWNSSDVFIYDDQSHFNMSRLYCAITTTDKTINRIPVSTINKVYLDNNICLDQNSLYLFE